MPNCNAERDDYARTVLESVVRWRHRRGAHPQGAVAEQSKTSDAQRPAGHPPTGLESFEHLFGYFAPRLRAYFVRRGANTTCDELVQEVMLTVWTKRDQFDSARGSVSAWIFTIARNKHLDSVRRRYPEPDPQDPLWVHRGPEPVVVPEEHAAQRQRWNRLNSAVSELPAELRALLIALYQDGKSMSDVATETGTPLGTIKTRARRALALLRQRVSEPEP